MTDRWPTKVGQTSRVKAFEDTVIGFLVSLQYLCLHPPISEHDETSCVRQRWLWRHRTSIAHGKTHTKRLFANPRWRGEKITSSEISSVYDFSWNRTIQWKQTMLIFYLRDLIFVRKCRMQETYRQVMHVSHSFFLRYNAVRYHFIERDSRQQKAAISWWSLGMLQCWSVSPKLVAIVLLPTTCCSTVCTSSEVDQSIVSQFLWTNGICLRNLCCRSVVMLNSCSAYGSQSRQTIP